MRRTTRYHVLLALLLALFSVPTPDPGKPIDPNPATSYCDQLAYTPYGALPPVGCEE
jgi:hypothetical protein